MFKAHSYLQLPAVLAVLVLTAAPACASYGRAYGQPGYGRVDDRAYRSGYNEGRKDGESDAKRGRSADYDRHEDYRDADDGFRGGNKNEYRQVFRRGYAEGYNDSYRRYSRNDDRPGRPGPGPVFGGPGRPDRSISSPAAANGFRDGLAQGREDARDRHRFDPVRSSRYRAGDRDYNNRYGSRDDYKREYRAGFQQGYEQGYRGGRR
jgi:hypothetical protein